MSIVVVWFDVRDRPLKHNISTENTVKYYQNAENSERFAIHNVRQFE